MELYLVRHGAIEESTAFRGDPPLSPAGRAQAERLAERLAPLRFDRCFVSPKVRAQETAEALLTGRSLAAETHACLAEGALGALDGLERDDAARRFPEFFRLGPTVLARMAATGMTAPGGETRVEFSARAAAACELVRPTLFDPHARGLVVSHGGLLHLLLAQLLGHEPRDEASYGFTNCAVAMVRAYSEAPAYGPFAMLQF